MTNIDPDQIKVILATDCGSTTTKAILIQYVDGEYRQTHRGEAPTTVEKPFADVTMGVVNSVTEIGELAGRRRVGDDGRIISPATDTEGCDIYISTSSAGGGLQMMVAGVIAEMTAASAKRAALGAGSIVMDVIAANDGRRPHDQIQRIRDLRPDMILISGGTDGGTTGKVVQIAELVAPAKPQPRFGSDYSMPIIYAGNKDAREAVSEVFDEGGFDLQIVDNLRPVLERENLGPARDKIHDIFLEHVMAQAPGYEKLMSWTGAPIMPTPGAVGDILQTVARLQDINVVGVDIGGATTDVFSVFDKTFNRTVSANLGMSYSISNVCAEATMPNVLRWVLRHGRAGTAQPCEEQDDPADDDPPDAEALMFEQAVAREALRLAYKQHKEFATTLKGVQQQRTVGDTFSQQTSGQTIVNNMTLDLLVASGGVLSHAPRMHQTAMMLIDAFEPEGVTMLAKDSIFMMPHLGVLSSVHPKAAEQVFDRDCLVYLGTCVCAAGQPKPGKTCFKYELTGDRTGSGEIRGGQMELLPLAEHESATITLSPARGIDLGEGPGKKVQRSVRGGTVGLILDGRGRPLALPEERSSCQTTVQGWLDALDVYKEETEPVGV